MSSAEGFVESVVKSRKIAIFSKTTCPYCKKIKATMASFKLKPDVYEVVEIDERPDCEEIQNYMLKKTGARSVSTTCYSSVLGWHSLSTFLK